MQERFLRVRSVEPEGRRWSLGPRSWPRWTRPFVLFAVVAAVAAAVGAGIAAWNGRDVESGVVWGLYGGGALLLFFAVGPSMAEPGSVTLGGADAEAHQRHVARLGEIPQTLLYFALGAGLIGIGLLLELYA